MYLFFEGGPLESTEALHIEAHKPDNSSILRQDF
jgi:hypothetical protein